MMSPKCEASNQSIPGHRMFSGILWNVVLYVILVLVAIPTLSQADPLLERISIVERSDRKGFVVRFHMTEQLPEQNMRVDQPDPNSINVTLLSTRIASRLTSGAPQGPVLDYSVRYRQNNIVVSFELAPGHPLRIVAYPDRASNDFLVALNHASTDEATQIVSNAVYEKPMQADKTEINEVAPLPVKKVSHSRSLETSRTTSSAVTEKKLKEDGQRWQLDCLVLDAGHGGHDRGTRGNGIYEKDLNLSVTLQLGKMLEKELGMRVVYTRKTDTFIELADRGHIANQQCGKLFVSIHANGVRSSKAYGSEVYFLGLHKTNAARDVMERENSVIEFESDPKKYQKFTEEQLIVRSLTQSVYLRESEALAEKIESEFVGTARRHSRGVKQAGFWVLWQASMPAVLVELGFVTNRTEATFMKGEDGQKVLARSIFNAIKSYKEEYERGINLVHTE